MSTATAPTTPHTESTDTHTADQQTTADQAIQDQPAAVVVVQLDPAQVAQHPDNIRDASRGIKELTASIAEVGVLVPLIVVPVALVPGHDWPDTVTHVAVDGNRRQAAAAATGLYLPCIVRADLAAAKATARTMAVTGLVRDGLTPTEEAHAVAALFDAKMSGAAIGRAIGRSTAQVKTARRAAQVTAATIEQAGDYPLTLDQLAILADHQDDPEATGALLRAAPRGQMDHVVAQLRAEAIESAAISAALAPIAAELSGAGVLVVETEPDTTATGGPRLVGTLTAGEDPTGERFTDQSHQACPGHAVWLAAEYYPADPDEDTGEEVEINQVFLCTDPAGHGHVSHSWRDRDEPHGYRRDRPATLGAQSDADREAAAQAAAEQARTARSALVRLNKEALASQGVRREFLRQSFTVKSRQKKMTAWTLARLVHRDRTFLSWSSGLHSPLLAEVIGGKPAQIIADADPARHPLLLWAQMATAYEDEFPKDAHRCNSAERADYLRHLADLGYTLAEVDQKVIDTATPRWTPTLTAADLLAGDTDQPPADQPPADTADDSADKQDQEVSID